MPTSLRDIPGVTTQMMVALGENDIKTVEDLAGCATDDLSGWSERKDGETKHYAGRVPRPRSFARRGGRHHHAGARQGWLDHRRRSGPGPLPKRRRKKPVPAAE